jgi:hypothetical protein
VPITESESLQYKRQVLGTAAEVFSRSSAAGETGYGMERATYTALYDMTANPKDALKTMSLYEALANAKDDSARFKTLQEGFDKYAVSDRTAKERNATFEGLRLEDAKGRFGEDVRMRVLSSNPEAERALEARLKSVQDDVVRGTRQGETSDETRARFQAIEGERVEYKRAREEYEEKQRKYDSFVSKGATSGSEFHKASMDQDAAKKVFEKERAEYYSACFATLGGASKVDPIIDKHVYGGTSEGKMWGAYQGFVKDTSKASDMPSANKHLEELDKRSDPLPADHPGGAGPMRPKDPFKSMRDINGNVRSFDSGIGLNQPRPPQFSYADSAAVHTKVFESALGSGDATTMDAVSRMRERGLIK